MHDALAHRPRLSPTENEAEWTPPETRLPRHGGLPVRNEWQELIAFMSGDKPRGLPDSETYIAQQIFSRLLDLVDSGEALKYDQFTWKTRKYQELANTIFVNPAEDGKEVNNIVPFVNGLIGKLSRLYKFRDAPAVEEFVRKNENLTELLEEAHKKIGEYFGIDVSLELDVLRESDAKSSGRLFVLILTTLRPKEAVSRLDELDRDWWLNALPAAKGKVTIDIDYG